MADTKNRNRTEPTPRLEYLVQETKRLYKQGEYTQALPIAIQARDMALQQLGSNDSRYAATLDNLGEIHCAMGDFDAAAPLYQQALIIQQKSLPPNDHAILRHLCRLAQVAEAVGDAVSAEQHYLQALKTLESQGAMSVEDRSTCADILMKLGALYYNAGDYGAAKPAYQQAVDIRRETLGKNHPDTASSLDTLGILYLEMGDYAQAEVLLREVRDVRGQSLGPNHPDYAGSLQNLATLYIDTGDFEQAEQLLAEAGPILRKAYGEGEEYATVLNNQGILHGVMGEYDHAERYYKQALDIRRKVLPETHPNYVATLMNLGAAHAMHGEYETAKSYLILARDLTLKIHGDRHPSTASCLGSLAELYLAMGNFVEAQPLLRQALSIKCEVLGENHPYTANTMKCLAMLSGAMEDYDDALAWTQESERIDDLLINQVFGTSSERQRLALLEHMRLAPDFHMSLLLQAFSHDPSAKRTGLDLLLRRKAMAMEAQGLQRLVALSERHKELRSTWQMVTKFRADIANLMLSGSEAVTAENYPGILGSLTAAKEELERDLARQIAKMSFEPVPDVVDCQTVGRRLPPDSVLVEFALCYLFDFKAIPARHEQRWKPAHYLAFVLSAADPDNVHMIDLGQSDRIDQMIDSFRASIVGAENSRDAHRLVRGNAASHNDGAALRSALFDPLLPALGSAKHLFLAPDGDLTWLPFEALSTGNGRCLLDDYHISYLSTGRDVMRLGSPSTGHSTDPIVFADPDYDLAIAVEPKPLSMQMPASEGHQSRDIDRTIMRFERLPGTRAEGQQIAKLLGVQPFLGESAVKSRLKAQRSPRILHIATHGFFLPNQPLEATNREVRLSVNPNSHIGRLLYTENPMLRSGLALAGANTWCQGHALPRAAEDALLNGEDVAGLDLQDTELVVLSACETGLGEVQHGQGMFGLRRAFVLAGAKTLIMSLWRVTDGHQTQELMEDFYRRILTGEPRGDALHAAQLAMKVRYPNPFYWGAFICQGDPGPLA